MARVTQAHIDARREEILGAAATLFLQHGFHDVTMQEIAAEAGLSAGAIYRYYASKDELVHAFFEHCMGYGPEMMVRQTEPDAPPLQRLKAIAAGVQAMWIEKSGEHVLGEIQTSLAGIRQPEVGEMIRQAREPLYAALTEIIEEGQRLGEIDPALDTRSLVVALYAFVMGIGLIAFEHGEEQLEEQLSMMFGVFGEILERLGPVSGGGADLLNGE